MNENETVNIDNQFVNCSINAVNGVNSGKIHPFDEGVQLLCVIYRSGNKELMQRVINCIREIADEITEEEMSEETENDRRKPVTETITGCDHPADNLHCLRSMTEFMKASAIAIGANDRTLSVTEWDGFANMLSVISEDLGLIADNL